jgi:predicted ester cyclase
MKTRILIGSYIFALAAILLGAVTSATAQSNVNNNDIPKPKSLSVDKGLSKAEADKVTHAGMLFYAFWNTGNEKYLHEAISDDFFDNTLPKGRPQGFKGILFASANFRKAVPDLRCSVEDMIITKDKVICRQIYTGHNTGPLGDHTASDKPVKFSAIDILHVRNGKVYEDWHLEDNLTFLQEIGVVK